MAGNCRGMTLGTFTRATGQLGDMTWLVTATHRTNQHGLHRPGLDYTGLDYTGLDYTGLDYTLDEVKSVSL